MKNKITAFKNIRTHNLKGIDFTLRHNSINCIIGPSGSGKSSLAFDTVYAISEHEYNKLLGDESVCEYILDEYSNILVGIALKQTNYNTNKRSTIATYYGLDTFFKHIFAIKNNVSADIFTFNKYSSSCKKCNGLGYVLVADPSLIIDYNLTLKDIPFLPWKNTMQNYYKQLLSAVANEHGINMDTPFRKLNNKAKTFLLYGSGKQKYKISFIRGGRKSVKTDTYHGVLTSIETELTKNNSDVISYTKEVLCPACNGTRFDEKVNKYKVLNKSLGEVYLMGFVELKEFLLEVKEKNNDRNIDNIINLVGNMIEMKLGYLFLNRSIPSLSGGEFQRLRFSHLLNTRFENLLFVLDEPLKSLHVEEKKSLIKKIENMKEKNTILIVEHDSDIIPICDKVVALGNSGGADGGHIISSEKYLSNECKTFAIEHKKTTKKMQIVSAENVNNVKPFTVDLPLGVCVGVGGMSGSGKTTFVRDILPKHIDGYKYISQKPIRGNAYSTVASYLEIIDKIRDLFAKENKMPSARFSHYQGSVGACKVCHGVGEIRIDEYDKKYFYVCPECNGDKYSNEIKKYRYFGFDIVEVLGMEINTARDFFEDKNKVIFQKLSLASKFGLGYLKLRQNIKTLSGGESQRIKLLRNLDIYKENSVIALDEPFQGLNNSGIYSIMNALYDFVEKNNTIIIVEHNLLALRLCSYIIEFGPESGTNGGNILFNGHVSEIGRCRSSVLKKYL